MIGQCCHVTSIGILSYSVAGATAQPSTFAHLLRTAAIYISKTSVTFIYQYLSNTFNSNLNKTFCLYGIE